MIALKDSPTSEPRYTTVNILPELKSLSAASTADRLRCLDITRQAASHRFWHRRSVQFQKNKPIKHKVLPHCISSTQAPPLGPRSPHRCVPDHEVQQHKHIGIGGCPLPDQPHLRDILVRCHSFPPEPRAGLTRAVSSVQKAASRPHPARPLSRSAHPLARALDPRD